MMNNTERMQAFEEFVKVCNSTKYGEVQLVGQGNPQSDILLVGMEPAIDLKENTPEDVIRINAEHCKNTENYGGTRQRTDFKGNHTWIVYQKLIDYIRYGSPQNEPILDFEKYAFTTEMNNWVSKNKAINSGNRDLFEEKLAQRRKLFKESAFIQDFPVVILGCSDYIINFNNVRQIDDTFDVKFIKEYEVKTQKDASYKFWTHNSSDGKRLVIHTRQLSGAIPDIFLESMAKVIKEHLEKVKGK